MTYLSTILLIFWVFSAKAEVVKKINCENNLSVYEKTGQDKDSHGPHNYILNIAESSLVRIVNSTKDLNAKPNVFDCGHYTYHIDNHKGSETLPFVNSIFSPLDINYFSEAYTQVQLKKLAPSRFQLEVFEPERSFCLKEECVVGCGPQDNAVYECIEEKKFDHKILLNQIIQCDEY